MNAALAIAEEAIQGDGDVVKLAVADRPANERPVIFCAGCGSPTRHSFSSAKRVQSGKEVVGIATIFTCGTCDEERQYGFYDPASVQVRV